ncbi:MAG: response regulator [Candidatus Rokubacteria bacterium]|nr:response regulator [Candidatus Rokubacteria bacterium]
MGANVSAGDRKILVVDDDEAIRDLLAEIVTDLGCQAIVAREGVEALDRFHSERPAVVLTDLRLPGINGLELTRRIRAVDPDAVVLIVTGHADLPTAIEAVRQGAFDYVRKPFDVEVLSERLLEALDRRLGTAARAERERLAAVGEVNVTLNHSILNPLSGILGALHVLKGDDLDPAAKAEAIDQARQEAARIETTVKRFGSLTAAPATRYVGETTMLDLPSPLLP